MPASRIIPTVRSKAFADVGKPDRIPVLHRLRPETPIVDSAGDHDRPHPFKDGRALGSRPAVEIVREMPGETPPFGGPAPGNLCPVEARSALGSKALK